MTSKPDPATVAAWLRRLDRATSGYEKSRAALDELIADARAARVPLIAIAAHTPYSREWARQIADRVDAARASATPDKPVPAATVRPSPVVRAPIPLAPAEDDIRTREDDLIALARSLTPDRQEAVAALISSKNRAWSLPYRHGPDTLTPLGLIEAAISAGRATEADLN